MNDVPSVWLYYFSSFNAVSIYMTPFRGWNWFRTEFMRLVGTVIRSRNVGRQMAVVETWMEVRRLAFSRYQMETFPALLALCASLTDPRWIPRTKASDAEL